MRPVRWLTAPLACLAIAVAIGCGGDDSSSGIGSALSYVPAETPFAVAVDTDLEGDQYKALDSIVNRFPGADTIKALLKAQLSMGQEGVDFDKDLKPLLGEPAVISATDVTSFLSDTDESGFVAALKVSDTDALDSLIEKTKAQERGEVAGATVYQDEDTFFGVDGDMVVLAGSRDLLEAALERADGGESLSEDDFDAALDGLPDDALARVYVDVQALLGQGEDAQAARRIAWVDALRTLGLTLSAQESSIDVEFNLGSEGDLSDADLPLASGDEPAQVVQRPNEIGIGLRDPSQVVAFFESALQAVDPDTFGDYEQGKRAIEGRLDIDVQRDVIEQLTGNLSISVTIDGDFSARAELKDAAAFEQTFDKVVEALPEFGVDGVTRTGDLYTLNTADGFSLAFGVAGDAFVLGSDAARAREMATAQPSDVDGASGSLVVSADAEGIAREVLAGLAPQLGLPDPVVPVFARPFDELKGSIVSSTDGMKGKVSLTLD